MFSNIPDNEKESSTQVPPKSSKYKRSVITIANVPSGRASSDINNYLIHNKKICQLFVTCTNNLPKILELCYSNLSHDLILWVSIPLSSILTGCIENFIDNGFCSPYIGNETPFGKKIEHSLVLTKKNENVSQSINSKRIILNSMYILQQYRTGETSCNMFAKFSTKAIQYLKKLSRMGHTRNRDNSISQKELGGELIVNKVTEGNGQYVYEIGVNKESVKPGVEEEVSVFSTRYNFHSHPEEAYVRHNVDKAWPSLTDYFGY